jgi:hypothetical protein
MTSLIAFESATFALPATNPRQLVIYQEGIRFVQKFSENRGEIRHHV